MVDFILEFSNILTPILSLLTLLFAVISVFINHHNDKK